MSRRVAGSDPLHRLVGDLGDPVVIGVVVQDGPLRSFGRRGDDQIRDLYAAVVEATDVGQKPLNLEGSLECRWFGCDDPQRRQLFRQGLVVVNGSRRPEDLESDLIADPQPVTIEIALPHPSHLGAGRVVPGARVDTQELHRRGRLSVSSSGERSIPRSDTMRSASRSRRERLIASWKALSTVSLRPLVPSACWALRERRTRDG